MRSASSTKRSMVTTFSSPSALWRAASGITIGPTDARMSFAIEVRARLCVGHRRGVRPAGPGTGARARAGRRGGTEAHCPSREACAATALARAAQLQAEQMAAAGKLGHELPGSRYPTLTSRLRLVGYQYRAVGENVAEGYTSGAALMAGWMTSAPHRSNILSARYTETGVGTARSKTGRTYHAQVFARPRATSGQ